MVLSRTGVNRYALGAFEGPELVGLSTSASPEWTANAKFWPGAERRLPPAMSCADKLFELRD